MFNARCLHTQENCVWFSCHKTCFCRSQTVTFYPKDGRINTFIISKNTIRNPHDSPQCIQHFFCPFSVSLSASTTLSQSLKYVRGRFNQTLYDLREQKQSCLVVLLLAACVTVVPYYYMCIIFYILSM